MKKVLISLMALASSGMAYSQNEEPVKTVETPAEHPSQKPQDAKAAAGEGRELDNHGLGFGFGSGPATAGLQLYYDYNLNPRPNGFDQIHVFLYSGSAAEESLTGGSEVELTQQRVVASYRRVWKSGWFAGVGLGAVGGELKYKYDETWLDASYPVVKKTFSYSAGVLMADLGWQGNDGYYFTVGIQPTAFLGFKGNYDESKIPAVSNHRMKASDLWGHAEEDKSLFNIGFGWYID
jgi:hypothetical protein